MNFNAQLTQEQEFSIASFQAQIQGASREQAIEIAVSTFRHYQHQCALVRHLVAQKAAADLCQITAND